MYNCVCVCVIQLDAQRLKREEALMVADAFRIAFEQQLRKRNEHFLVLAEANILKSHHCKAEGKSAHSATLDHTGRLGSGNFISDMCTSIHIVL